MALDFNISPKTATALMLIMAVAAFSVPISGHAENAQSPDCTYTKNSQSLTSVQAPVSPTEVRPANGQKTGSRTVPSAPLGTEPTPVHIKTAAPHQIVVNNSELIAAPVIPHPSSTDTHFAVNSGPASSESKHMTPRMPIDTEEAGQSLDNRSKIAQAETVAITKLAKQDTMTTKSKPTPEAPDLWRNVLVNHTNKDADGLVRFDYAGLKAAPNDMDALTRYIDQLAAQKPSTFARSEAMAYWANLYNALTVRIVAENYPVKSIRKIKSGLRPGPWKKNLVTVEGEKLSLDNIEHDIMRPSYGTPLVHYMLNCASVGCPNLKETPWQAASLDADLDKAARAFINSPRGVSTDRGRLQVSSIYKWFQKDFGDSQQGVLSHLAQYADEDVAAKLLGRKKIDKFEYDWGVNAR